MTSRGRDATDRGATDRGADGRPVFASMRPEGSWHGSMVAVVRPVAAASDTVNGPRASTFALMMRTRSPGPDTSLPVAPGWRLVPLDGRDIYWHDAHDARRFSASLAMDPSRGRAAAVLSNSARPVDAIAGQIPSCRMPSIDAAPVAPVGGAALA